MEIDTFSNHFVGTCEVRWGLLALVHLSPIRALSRYVARAGLSSRLVTRVQQAMLNYADVRHCRKKVRLWSGECQWYFRAIQNIVHPAIPAVPCGGRKRRPWPCLFQLYKGVLTTATSVFASRPGCPSVMGAGDGSGIPFGPGRPLAAGYA